MARADSTEQARLERLTEPLRVMHDGSPPVLETWLPELRVALGSEQVLAYGLRETPEGHALVQPVALGFSSGQEPAIGAIARLHQSGRRWTFFDPSRPEAPQRNRAILLGALLPAWKQLSERPRLFRSRYGVGPEIQDELAATLDETTRAVEAMGILESHRLRTLICEGDSLLAYVGAYREAPFTPVEIRLLRAVIPRLQRRLSVERLLGTAALTRAALTAALEQLARPAYVLGLQGAVAAANSLGRAALDRDPTHTRQRLAEALRNGDSDPAFRVEFLASPGVPQHALAIEQGAPAVGDVSDSAASRWGLTPRETEVLNQIALGQPNKAISSALGCSDKTVELHVTRLLRKAEVDSRSALIAKLWSRR